MIKPLHLYLFVVLLLCGCNQCKDGCLNGACIDQYCDCDVWYTGDRCDRSELSIYEGAYVGTFIFGSSAETLSFSLVGAADNPSQLIANELDLKFQFTSSTRFDVPAQTWKNIEWIGEGEMLLGLISIRLNYTDSSGVKEGLIEAYRED